MMRRMPIASDRDIRPSDSIAVADRNRLIETHVDLASSLARRFKGRGEELDDLRQVALLALVQAAERFDPSYGFAFTTFATPTIVGALKRHLRDQTWAIRPPRSSQERYLQVNAAVEALTGTLRRLPDIAQIAAYGAWSEQEVRSALAEKQFRVLEHTDAESEDRRYRPGCIDAAFACVEDRHVLGQLLEGIGLREREIVEMRYFGELTQADIGQRIGVSQMHVSRLLKMSLASLRAGAAKMGLAS